MATQKMQQTLAAILMVAIFATTASGQVEQVHSVQWLDTEGDRVEVKSENGMLNLYGNGRLAIRGLEWTQISDLKVVFGNPQEQAETTVTDVAHLEQLNVLVVQHNARREEAVRKQLLEAFSAPSSTDPTSIEWKDTDGDMARLRSEGEQLNLYSNGDLVLPDIRVMDVDADGVTIRLVTATGVAAASIALGETEAQKVLAFFKSRLAPQMIADVPFSTEPAFVDWKDTEGDAVSLRAEGDQLNLYGNGQLMFPDVRVMEIDPDGVNMRFVTAKGSRGESTFLSEAEAQKVVAFFQTHVRRQATPRQGPTEVEVRALHQQFMRAMAAEAAQKPHAEVDGGHGDGVKRRARELIIYGEGDPMAPGYKDPSEPVWKFSHHHVLHLGRHTFAQSVLPPVGSPVEHWIVLFCYNWWEPCQQISEPYSAWAAEWEAKLNRDLFTKHVRFAKVDCATDKELCNSQGVEGYPHVAHYAAGAAVAKWTGGRDNDGERVQKWLNKQLGKREPKPGDPIKEAQKESVPNAYGAVQERGINILLVVGVLALNFRAVCLNAGLWKGPPATATAPHAAAHVATAAPFEAPRADVFPAEWSRRSSMEL